MFIGCFGFVLLLIGIGTVIGIVRAFTDISDKQTNREIEAIDDFVEERGGYVKKLDYTFVCLMYARLQMGAAKEKPTQEQRRRIHKIWKKC